MSLSRKSLGNAQEVRLDDGGRNRAYFFRRDPSRVDRELLEELKDVSHSLGDRNVRVCLHPDAASPMHEMIILERRGGYLRPHKHLHKGESYHVIEGEMGAVLFDEAGTVLDACRLTDRATFLYRVGAGMFHAVLPLSDLVIYHECKLGPFTGEGDSVWPDWAPDGRNSAEAQAFTQSLVSLL